MIVTYRPSELLLLKHPFIGVKRDLLARSVCRDIEVEFLTLGDVERYFARKTVPVASAPRAGQTKVPHVVFAQAQASAWPERTE
jgi:hypothetical protein